MVFVVVLIIAALAVLAVAVAFWRSRRAKPVGRHRSVRAAETVPPEPGREHPEFHTDAYGGSGWIWFDPQRDDWLVEHTCGGDGRWSACPLGVGRVSTRDAHRKAMAHLRRKAHRGPVAQQLAGIAHGGGGAFPFVQGPRPRRR